MVCSCPEKLEQIMIRAPQRGGFDLGVVYKKPHNVLFMVLVALVVSSKYCVVFKYHLMVSVVLVVSSVKKRAPPPTQPPSSTPK